MHRNLPTYLSGDPEGTLEFDVRTFVREAGLADTCRRRLDVAEIAGRIVHGMYPRARMIIVRLGLLDRTWGWLRQAFAPREAGNGR